MEQLWKKEFPHCGAIVEFVGIPQLTHSFHKVWNTLIFSSVVDWICLKLDWLLAVTGVMHDADSAYSIGSTWSCYWLDQFLTLALNTLILSIFYISLDLSTIYVAHFGGCWASFVCSCHSIPECCVVFSGVKLSMGLFILFLIKKQTWLALLHF